MCPGARTKAPPRDHAAQVKDQVKVIRLRARPFPNRWIVLEEALRLPVAFVGAMGSRRPHGDTSALLSLVQIREEARDKAEAERLAHAAADRGHSPALGYLAELQHGVVEDYQRYGLEADGTLAACWAWPEPRCIASDAP